MCQSLNSFYWFPIKVGMSLSPIDSIGDKLIPPSIGNPYHGYINPYYWVDDQPYHRKTMAGVLTPQSTYNKRCLQFSLSWYFSGSILGINHQTLSMHRKQVLVFAKTAINMFHDLNACQMWGLLPFAGSPWKLCKHENGHGKPVNTVWWTKILHHLGWFFTSIKTFWGIPSGAGCLSINRSKSLNEFQTPTFGHMSDNETTVSAMASIMSEISTNKSKYAGSLS